MPSITAWGPAPSPNYVTNTDKLFPYSEVPNIGQYKLLKIPVNTPFIEHIDYWGEGRIDDPAGVSGFRDCYNINDSYQCVSNGPDKGRKIPNRIPVRTYTDCNTSSYVKDGSVLLVTLMGAPINNSCAADIARIVNEAKGKIIVFGFNPSLADIRNLKSATREKKFVCYTDYDLPTNLQGLTLFDKNKNGDLLYQNLKDHVKSGRYSEAVASTKDLINSSYADKIHKVVTELISDSNPNVVSFAYKLWNNNAQKAVLKHFPEQFKLIFNEDVVKVASKKFGLPLKLDANTDSDNDRKAWGHGHNDQFRRLQWKTLAYWNEDKNRVAFRLMNVDCGMFLKLAVSRDSINDREAYGAYSCPDDRHRWYLEPVLHNGELLFFIINCEYGLGLKLAARADDIDDRQLWGHYDDVRKDAEYFGWYIKPF